MYTDEQVKQALALFLAKLGVGYRYESYPIAMQLLSGGCAIPPGAIVLPIFDIRIHALVPFKRWRQ